jgi:hypothetical protein
MPRNVQAIPEGEGRAGKKRAGEGARPGHRRNVEPRHIADILAELPELRPGIIPTTDQPLPRTSGDGNRR